ncbi:hypothetical protein FHT44_005185 [Mycolicibacterium sp. BK634]|uniref:hypothetical protein n=1 Tax=Mycolicibacterium sp. BK634 TaxID=2587099 RepID=UPI0016137D36|nr:hypothetical protein [Mycolicibacterium sp. BK634]MBB3752673.1 hypothetical protein [Mycolicibacterium sp. BK634]
MGKTTLDDRERAIEQSLIDDLEKLLDKYMVSQEDMPDGWVIDTVHTVLEAVIGSTDEGCVCRDDGDHPDCPVHPG